MISNVLVFHVRLWDLLHVCRHVSATLSKRGALLSPQQAPSGPSGPFCPPRRGRSLAAHTQLCPHADAGLVPGVSLRVPFHPCHCVCSLSFVIVQRVSLRIPAPVSGHAGLSDLRRCGWSGSERQAAVFCGEGGI